MSATRSTSVPLVRHSSIPLVTPSLALKYSHPSNTVNSLGDELLLPELMSVTRSTLVPFVRQISLPNWSLKARKYR